MKNAPLYTHFDGMAWPLPGETSWRLRYNQPSRSDALHAASIVEAYHELIRCPEKKRRKVIRELRAALMKNEGR